MSHPPNFQDGNDRGNQKYHLQMGVGSHDKFNRYVLSHSHTQEIKRSAEISFGRSVVSVLVLL